MSEFDIGFLFNTPELVKTINLYSNTYDSNDERGETDSEPYTLIGSDSAIVLTSDGNTVWGQVGLSIDRDYDIYLKDDSSLATSLKEGYYIEIDSVKYKIRAITQNPGHYEIAVKR